LPFLSPRGFEAFPPYSQVIFFKQAEKYSYCPDWRKRAIILPIARQPKFFHKLCQFRTGFDKNGLTGEHKANLEWPSQPRRSERNCPRLGGERRIPRDSARHNALKHHAEKLKPEIFSPITTGASYQQMIVLGETQQASDLGDAHRPALSTGASSNPPAATPTSAQLNGGVPHVTNVEH